MGNNRERLLFICIGIVIFSFLVFGAPVREIPTTLTIAGQPPNITNVELNDNISGDEQMILTAADTTIIWCAGDVYDLDGFPDLDSGNGTIWHRALSSYGAADDNRWHYTNSSCNLTEVTGTPNVNGLLNCTFEVWFYANYSEWNCSLWVNDTIGYKGNGTDNATMNRLVAVNSPNTTIDWGTRAVDYAYDTDLDVSVYNEGNVILDLQLDAYNETSVGIPSNYSFNCTLGQIPTDVIVYNDSVDSPYAQSTSFSNSSYINVSDFNLDPQDGTTNSPTNKSAYFGINIPGQPFVNGTCTGWMRFEGMDGSPP